jgi:hypothetical protein
MAADTGLPISSSYRYPQEAIDVIAEQAPDVMKERGLLA